MKKAIYLLLFLSTFILTGCVTQSKIMASWVGKTKAELYQKLGIPTTIKSDGQGGEILIYTYIYTGQDQVQINYNQYGGITYTAPANRDYTKAKMFYINSSGVIYSFTLLQGLI
jgi:hypothetical protein